MQKSAEKVARGLILISLIVGILVSRQSVLGVYMPADEEQEPEESSIIETITEPARAILEERMKDVDGLIGIEDTSFDLIPPDAFEQENKRGLPPLTEENIEQLRDFEYLRTQFYMSDRNTRLLPSDIDADDFMQADLTINSQATGPQVLIFHTHSTEMFADSDPNNPMDGVLGLGASLAQILEQQYGIKTLHDTTRFDIVDGRSHIMGAYERMEPYIKQILQENPSIEIVIDLHRDGLPEGAPPMVTYINNQRTARIMFVNGLSRWYNRDGILEPVPWLPNPNLQQNLKFSFQLQMAANQMYPGLARRVYLKAFRYSLHLLPRTTLIEVGAQNNTIQEAQNALPPLASIIAEVILPK